MTNREPRWVIAFLRALERTGEARMASEDAGIDHSTAYARRRAHAEFAERWEAALRVHADTKAAAEAEEIAAIRNKPSPSPPSPSPSPSPSPGLRRGPLSLEGRAADGTEVIVSDGKVRRVGYGRWSKAKEAIFFEELAATNNVKMAAKAAGVSANAVGARRLKHPLFAAKWEAVVQTAKAAIDLYLLEETKKTFDPDTLDTAEVTPRVTIDQAIKISQLNRPKAPPSAAANPFAEQSPAMGKEGVEELRERLLKRMMRLRARGQAELVAQGWSYDESHDQVVPPGWVQAPDAGPKEAEE